MVCYIVIYIFIFISDKQIENLLENPIFVIASNIGAFNHDVTTLRGKTKYDRILIARSCNINNAGYLTPNQYWRDGQKYTYSVQSHLHTITCFH